MRRLCLGIAAALASASGAALAQSAALPERRVDIRASGRATYDSNTVRRRASLPGAELEAEDIRFTPSAVLDIVLPFSRQALFLNGSIGYDFYLRNSRLNRERIGLIGGADLRLPMDCSTRVAGEYARQQSNLADLFSLTRLINTEEIRAVDVQASCGDAIGLQPGFGYRHETGSNSEPTRRRDNYVSDTWNASIAYVRPTFGSLSLFTTYSKTTYPNRPIIGPGGPTSTDEGVEIYTGGARFDRQIGSRLRGSVSAGITRAEPNTPGVPQFSGLSYAADISYSPNDRIQLTLGFSRQADVSNTLDTNYSINETYSLDGTYALSQRLRVNFGSSYADRSFVQSPNVPELFARGGDKTYLGFVGVEFDLNDRLSLDADFTQERRDSDNPAFDYKSTRISAGISLSI